MLIKITANFCLMIAFLIGSPTNSQAQCKKTQCKKEGKRGHVLIWLDANCPLSQKGALSVKSLYQQYADSNIQFIAIFPEDHKHKAQKFMQSCGLVGFPFMIDHKNKLTQQFGATTTPEAVLLDPLQQIKYQGQVDNLLISTETFRLQATEFYLKDAIEAMLQQKEIALVKTEPIGSGIE